MRRPKPHILISINSDGSGSVTQYESYALAKVAYDALSSGTTSAFIYPKPRKSLSQGAVGSPVAIPAKVEFTKIQNATAIYNPGNPAFTAPHPALAQFIPTVPTQIQTPPLPRVTTSGPFGGNEGYNEWQAFCKLNPTHPQCTTPGNPQYGTLLSESCFVTQNYTDAIGKTWPTVANVKVKIFANGVGGEYEEFLPSNSKEGGCFFPAGFATEEVNNSAYYDNSASNPEKHFARLAFETYTTGGGWMPVFDLVALDGWTYYGGQDGQGNQKDYVLVGLPPIGQQPHNGLVNYGQGSYLRDVNFNTLSQWSVNGIPVTNEPAPTDTEGQLEIHEGKWFSDFDYYESNPAPNTEVGQSPTTYPRQVRLRFRYKPNGPISPFETVPSKTRAGRGIFNEFFSTDLLGIDSSETVQPVVTYEYDYQNVLITEMSQEVPVGQKQKAVLTAIVDGPMQSGWSDIKLYVYGTLLASDGTNNYRAVGDGTYYVEQIEQPPLCDPPGYNLGYGSRDEFIYPEEDDAPALLVGTTSYGNYADGNCGSYEDGHTTTYRENGDYLGDGNTLKFYSNGSGGYYTTPKNPASGTELGYNITEPLMSNGFQVGTITSPAYADGNGGAVAGGAGTTSYYESGTLVGTMEGYNYYSNGMGGTYSEPSGPPYPSYGTFIESVSGNNYYNAGCGDWAVGYYSYNLYADGSGGTYSDNNTGGNYDYGTYLGNCSDYDYYADGNGGTYTQGGGNTCPSSGDTTGNSGSDPITVDVGCGSWTIGNTPWTEYHDGSCGYYTSSGSPSYYSWETFLGECNGYYYYSDGSGGYFTY
jgi:hypothetical protein